MSEEKSPTRARNPHPPNNPTRHLAIFTGRVGLLGSMSLGVIGAQPLSQASNADPSHARRKQHCELGRHELPVILRPRSTVLDDSLGTRKTRRRIHRRSESIFVIFSHFRSRDASASACFQQSAVALSGLTLIPVSNILAIRLIA
jgi:hypothetical protein